MALSLEVTTEPPPDISERSPISLRTQALARWAADAGYDRPAAGSSRTMRGKAWAFAPALIIRDFGAGDFENKQRSAVLRGLSGTKRERLILKGFPATRI
jgi:hypothetical protein